MAFDSSDFPVPQESSCYMQLGWQCDFYFGYGFDVIEEDATNEKYCIQVLRILITKADTEIDELEKDLVFLQNELAGVEYEEWFEICCNALRKQIDCLYIAVRSLKSKDKNDIEVRFLMYRKPLKSLHEILKALLGDYCNDKDKQPLDAMVLDSFDSTVLPPEHLEENSKFIFSDSSTVVKEESQASSITYSESGSFLNTPLTHQEKKRNNSEAAKFYYEQPRYTNGKDSSPNSLKSEAGDHDEKEVLSTVDMEPAMKGEAREHYFTSVCNQVIQNSSLNSMDERRCSLELAMDQPVDIMLKNPNGTGLKHVVNYSNKKEKICSSNSKIVSDEAEENSSASTEDVIILDSASNSMGKDAKLCRRIKPINTVDKELDSNACSREEGHHNVRRNRCKPHLEVNGNEEVSTYHTTTAGKDKILDSPSDPEGKVHPPKAQKQPANAVIGDANTDALRHSTGVSRGRNNSGLSLCIPRQAKVGNLDSSSESTGALSHTTVSRQEKVGNLNTSLDALSLATGLSSRRNNSDSALTTSRHLRVRNSHFSPPALRHATGLEQGRNNSDSKVGGFRQAKGGNCEFDQKLCDFAQKAARKRGMKESNLILADRLKSSHLSPEVKGKGKPSLQIVKVEKSCLTDTEMSALTSLLDLQDDKGKKRGNAQAVEGKKLGEDVQMTETVAHNVKYNTGLSVKPQKHYGKRKSKSNSPGVKESGLQSLGIVPQPSFVAKSKGQWKSEPGSDSSSSNHSLNSKMRKKAVQHVQCEAEEQSIALDDSQNSTSQPQKKRKKNLSIPVLVEIKGSTLQIDLSKSRRDLNHAAGKDDLSITESYSIDSCTEVVTSSSFATSKLMELKIGELRAIAKEQKLTKYYKLRKTDLVGHIANKLGSC
ncbi:uncharacterized protein LOC123198170 isoform X3 [Mangifera indica]|uniref:uncharacterized protein LOC123198170 isoform X3 n=1 Tax=Mangifera indica TaxID=29780 RepID=UPI001CF9EBDC|nr:uncharacterized protein LOC123198170 isoform X3 [Mangifera indica]